MITVEDLVTITLNQSQLAIVLQQASLSCIGGASEVRQAKRQSMLEEDQISGHACHMAASIYLFGSIDKFLEQRYKANSDPYHGDGGVDFLGTKIDVKGGNKRKSVSILDYNLIVSEKEYLPDLCYISALTKFKKYAIKSQDQLKVRLIGWASSEMLEKQIFYDKPKRMLRNRSLSPMSSVPEWAFGSVVRIK